MPVFSLHQFQYYDIQPVDLTLKAHQCLGLTGPSGSGKSRLLRALADLEEFSGDVRLDGVSCNDFKPCDWRRRIGLLPAESQWWYDSVGEHYSDYDENLLSQLGFGPDVMDWPVSRLSSGEKKRLSLLRLLANQPSVVLLDEPTANLDPGFIDKVENILLNYKNSHPVSCLWVSHDEQQLQRTTDRIWRLENKKWQEVQI